MKYTKLNKTKQVVKTNVGIHINVCIACIYMVKVITIRDDVYERLSSLKKRHAMSFSQAIDLLLNESKLTREGLLDHAGKLKEVDIDRRALYRLKRWGSGD